MLAMATEGTAMIVTPNFSAVLIASAMISIVAPTAAPAFQTGAKGNFGAFVTPDMNLASPAQAIRKHRAILAVRNEALALQEADGGKLTDAHRAYLRGKLAAVLSGNY